MALPLSVFIIAKNEADRIGPTIRAVRPLTDDVVVVDSGSTDGTQAIAERLGARVIFNPWPGYGEQKRFAEEQCRHPWLLNVDADEVVTPALAAEIRDLFATGEPAADAYELPIVEVLPGDDRPSPFMWQQPIVRLYRRDKGRYNPSSVHDRVDLVPGARVGRLAGRVDHFSIRSLGHEIAKLNAYTDMQVADLAARGVRVPAWRVVAEFPAAFLKAYLLRRHLFRGVYGVLTAVNYAYARHLRVAKAYERQRLAARAHRSGAPATGEPEHRS